MGSPIAQFNTDELSRAALPGAIASTLFWVLPAGDWHPSQLDLWWQHFTKSSGTCNRYGMLLVKDSSKAMETNKKQS